MVLDASKDTGARVASLCSGKSGESLLPLSRILGLRSDTIALKQVPEQEEQHEKKKSIYSLTGGSVVCHQHVHSTSMTLLVVTPFVLRISDPAEVTRTSHTFVHLQA